MLELRFANSEIRVLEPGTSPPPQNYPDIDIWSSLFVILDRPHHGLHLLSKNEKSIFPPTNDFSAVDQGISGAAEGYSRPFCDFRCLTKFKELDLNFSNFYYLC